MMPDSPLLRIVYSNFLIDVRAPLFLFFIYACAACAVRAARI